MLIQLISIPTFPRTSRGSNYHELPLLTKRSKNVIFFDGEMAGNSLNSVDVGVRKEKE